MTALADHILRRFGIPWSMVCGPNRTQRVVYCRHLAAAVLRDSGVGVIEVGAALNRDHSTISQVVKKFRMMVEYDTQTAEDFRDALNASCPKEAS